MPRHPNHGTLPPASQLRDMYLAGESFETLARQYGVRRNTVYNKLHRDAIKNGTAWPLKQNTPGWRQRAGKRQSLTRWDGVNALILRAELRECRDTYRVTYAGIAVLAGMNPNHVYQITAGNLPRVSRRTCELLMAAIELLEANAAPIEEEAA